MGTTIKGHATDEWIMKNDIPLGMLQIPGGTRMLYIVTAAINSCDTVSV